jgi:hypothetical protein
MLAYMLRSKWQVGAAYTLLESQSGGALFTAQAKETGTA